MALNILMYVLFKNTLQLRAAGDPPLVQLVKTSKETIDVSPVGRGFNGRYGSEQFRFEKHNPGLLVGVVCGSGLTDLNHIRHQPTTLDCAFQSEIALNRIVHRNSARQGRCQESPLKSQLAKPAEDRLPLVAVEYF